MFKQIIILFTAVAGISGLVFYLALKNSVSEEPITINAVSTVGFPITSSFAYPDMLNTDYPTLFQEMKSVKIDTIIVFISEVTSPDCSNSFTDTYHLDNPNGSWASLIRAALAANLKIIVGPTPQNFNDNCKFLVTGTPTDKNTPMGRILSHLVTSVDKYKLFLAGEGVAWTDPRIAGLYIPEETSPHKYDKPDSPYITYYKEASKRLLPYGKPIMISPGQYESTDYNTTFQAFKNIINLTDISIIAPQDSMGYPLTTTAARSADHYRALADAKAAYPAENVQVWANIETYQRTSADPTYTPYDPARPAKLIPAPFTRVKSQIEAARPYVSKMTSWVYQYNMMTLPSANNLSSILTWNNMYTPDLATRRGKLKSDYLAAYGGALPTPTPSPIPSVIPSPSITPSPSPSGNPADLNTAGDTPADQINIFDYNSFVGDYGKTGVPGFVPADMKKDGAVNIFDYNILVANFDK